MTVVRLATTSDAAAIAIVHRLARARYYGQQPDKGDEREAMWASLLAQADRVTHVAERAGEVVAVVSTRPQEQALEMTALYVHPGHGSTGLGSLLLGVFDAQRREGHDGPAPAPAPAPPIGHRRQRNRLQTCRWGPIGNPLPPPRTSGRSSTGCLEGVSRRRSGR